ncbi:MAG: beta-galactosidase [Clostridia bacterium]|nr:beta-galactosidase [Clostridia bacterium]
MDEQRFAWNEMTVGVCYYPEHWDESLWANDLDRMLANGITVIRIAEFAWSIFERTEGEFSFDLFDRFLSLCAEKGMKVIFGTPTATPPAWLTQKYPEVLNATQSGVLMRHGLRRHYNYNSPVYRQKTCVIVEELAKHYATHPSIIGWQIDNEFNCEVNDFYSQADHDAFRVFLQKRYGTLDALNAAWGTVFWSQTYTEWDQIHVPRPTPNGSINPHLHLDYIRFVSESAISFCGLQAHILRKYLRPGVFITTNGMFGHLDNHRMTDEQLDVYTYDSYPNFAFLLERAGKLDQLRDRWSSKSLTEVRSICPHFGIMEQQGGPGSWYNRMETPTPRPGQLRLWAMQSVAHGADYISFFRWRTCTFGTEIYWHGLLNYDNRDTRRLREVAGFAADLKKLQPLCGAQMDAGFAIVRDYDNVWDAEIDTLHRAIHNQSENAIFEASQLYHTPCDMLYLRANTTLQDLAPYRALFMPHASILTRDRVRLLAEYVQQGGTLIVGCRTGYKDEYGRCVMAPMPGLLQPLTATDVADFTFTSPAEPVPCAAWDGETFEMPVYNDVLTPLDGAKVLARFTGSYYAGEAALTEHAYGKGRVLHLGGTFTVENTRRILAHLELLEPMRTLVEAPESIELVMRKKDGRRWLFALNYNSFPVSIQLKKPLVSLLTGKESTGNFELAPYGVDVWKVE